MLVAHQFEFVLLPPKDRLLKEHLGGWRIVQASTGDAAQIVLVVGKARAKATHRERRADDNGILQILCRGDAFIHRVADMRASAIGATPFDDTLEQFPVLAKVDGIEVRPDEFDVVPLKNARLCRRNRRVKSSLAAQRRQQSVGALFFDDPLNDLGCDRLDVGGIGKLGIGHDRRRV